jgi:hypothetical protein
MNKKILVVSISVVFMLVTISYASAINANNIDTEKKESPLYRIRTRRTITEKIGLIVENIKTKFLGERMFFLPFQSFIFRNSYSSRLQFGKDTESGWTCDQFNTCSGEFTCIEYSCRGDCPSVFKCETAHNPSSCEVTCSPTFLCGECTESGITAWCGDCTQNGISIICCET